MGVAGSSAVAAGGNGVHGQVELGGSPAGGELNAAQTRQEEGMKKCLESRVA